MNRFNLEEVRNRLDRLIKQLDQSIEDDDDDDDDEEEEEEVIPKEKKDQTR